MIFISNNKKYKPRSWWHIRKNYKSRHGALIVGEDNSIPKDEKYHYMDITTNPSKNDSYIPLSVPINLKGDKSHVRKYVGTKSKKYFSNWLMNYEISEKDLDEIEKYLKTKKDGKAVNKLNQKPSTSKLYDFKNKKSTNKNKKSIRK